MTMPFATGRYGIGMCDRCGHQTAYKDLKRQIINMKDSGLRVCSDCFDADHPQWQAGRWPIFDPQALQFPRPDPKTDRTNCPQLSGYTDIGTPVFSTNVTADEQAMALTGYAPTVRVA